jgi:hypothetical protein
MNAKEISDATLESVTPADNDLMLIYDTSEGTTGKATIADIAPKVAENIDTEDLTSNLEVFSQEITISNMGITVFKFGKVVTIFFENFIFSGTTTQQRLILKNLPIPKTTIFFPVSKSNQIFLLEVTMSGDLRDASDVPIQSGAVFGYCTYIVQ